MGNVYKDRYGIPGSSVQHLIRRYYRYFVDSDWYNADDFVKWCSENGWQKGLRLCRFDASLPHGPKNSYFKATEMTIRAKAEDVRRRKYERMNLVSPFCEGCDKDCPGKSSRGCDEWKEYFQKNWNANICIAPKKPEQKTAAAGQQVFRYEHPDLIREGIVWSHTENAGTC